MNPGEMTPDGTTPAATTPAVTTPAATTPAATTPDTQGPQRMRAIQITEHGGAEVLSYTEVDVPAPGPGQVRVRVRAAGLNPADTYMVRGGYEFFHNPLPWVPGFDSAGDIEAVGEGVEGLAVGDRVFVAGVLAPSSGAFGQYHVADASVVRQLPDSVSYAQGSAIGVPYQTAYHALFQRAGLRPGETVLIHGASGGVGQACVQFARAHGARVIATAGSAEGLDLARTQGAHVVLDHTAEDHVEAIRAAAPKGIDVVIEMAASTNLEHDLGLLARGGRVAIVGARTPVEITPRLVMRTEAAILGIALWYMTPGQVAEALAATAAGLETGTLSPTVGHELPLERLAEGFALVTTGHRAGKVVLTVE
ncbi:NADPH2:quinone reductase [Raineyella antarctica]|uniref:NADPH2:quinone reductase n=1 Tax=Raineyella antarctica TaxID=1577474 RepID=A0A1G6GLM7_9ACTN|nr:NADPH:quinone reductase [Raineyella antarctica]SDB82911.1 NADPH2:quinone reductase [Raineyella antarctica]